MQTKPPTDPQGRGNDKVRLLLFWSIVGIPLIWGVSMTVIKALELFR